MATSTITIAVAISALVVVTDLREGVAVMVVGFTVGLGIELGTVLAVVKTTWPSPCEVVGVAITVITLHVASQCTAMSVAPPSVATSRSPSRTPAAERAADDRGSTASVPGCALFGVFRSA